LERHYYSQVVGQPGERTTYTLLADRERGALKRLARIMARYPGFASYVQGDPRGCALYILRPVDTLGFVTRPGDGTSLQEWLSANYNRGIAVYK
jgi:hypothetical protein